MGRKGIILLVSLIIITLLVINPFKKDIWDVNAEHFKSSFNIISGDAIIDDLSEWTPFEWDKLYSFSPYISTDEIYEIVGYKWDKISSTVSENMNQIVFVKDGKVQCYIYGYVENTKLGFNFGEYEGDYIKLSSKDKLSFNIIFDEDTDTRYLEYIKK